MVCLLQTPYVFVVQVPPAPTPPTSECSSDTECNNLHIDEATGHSREEVFSIQTHPTSNDIIILPLSPESDKEYRLAKTASVIVSPKRDKPPDRHQSVIKSTGSSATITIPDRRMRKHSRKTATKNINNNDPSALDNNEIDVDDDEVDDDEDDLAGDAKKARTVSKKNHGPGRKANAFFLKVILNRS